MKAAVLAKLQAARAGRRPVALVTDLASGAQALLDGGVALGDLELTDDALAAAIRLLERDTSRAVEAGGRRVFVHVYNPPSRLIIVGAVHIAQALAPMAALMGYAVTIVDPRRAFATDARFPTVTLSDDWPDEAMEKLKPDRRTAVVTLTHDPKLDDPALAVALRSPAFYVGSLGSRRTHAKRIERLTAQGLSEAELRRIHGPVGLSIGAITPAEIAVSILGQITEARRKEAAA
ncbi:MAG: xanthine dehydrogenase [Alphaproteobacteria bacterium]|nr:xanthine dehydrogenase [Alphaproteobacteria bacterium]